MRIVHTSDWHIGRTLHGVDLHNAHAAYFDHLLDLVIQEEVDAVLVSGDVYDRAIPPLDSVELLSDTLARLSEHTHVVLTPGNHDSAIRLGFGARVMNSRVRVQHQIDRVATPIELPGKRGDSLHVYALPYLDPDGSRQTLAACCAEADLLTHVQLPPKDHGLQGETTGDVQPRLARSHEAVMRAAMDLVRHNMAQRTTRLPTVVMAHAFVVGGEPSESERDIRVGGVDSVPGGVFRGVDYVALGHLHGAQRVTVDGTLARYSGSPLAFSFSEMNHHKSTALLDIRPDGSVSQPELIAAPIPRKLSEITGTLDEVLGAQGDQYVDDWMRINITDAQRPAELNTRLRAKFPHALVIQHTPQDRGTVTTQAIEVSAHTDPVVVARQFVTDVTSTPPTDEEVAVLERALDTARATERSA